jgi:hypothetical protein
VIIRPGEGGLSTGAIMLVVVASNLLLKNSVEPRFFDTFVTRAEPTVRRALQ